jgi:uncharacterized membrane protein YgaE (UPF0421/DUF939 family)
MQTNSSFTPAQSSAMSAFHDSLTVAMNEANFVQVGEDVFSADYLHAPDEFTRPDDVLVEGTREDQELLLIQQDFEGAHLDSDGEIHLRDGTIIRFLRSAALH